MIITGMKGSLRFSGMILVSFVLIGSSALAQGEVASPQVSALAAMRALMLNKLDTASVILEEDIKNLETTLVEYFQSMDEVFAARDIVAKNAIAKDLKEEKRRNHGGKA